MHGSTRSEESIERQRISIRLYHYRSNQRIGKAMGWTFSLTTQHFKAHSIRFCRRTQCGAMVWEFELRWISSGWSLDIDREILLLESNHSVSDYSHRFRVWGGSIYIVFPCQAKRSPFNSCCDRPSRKGAILSFLQLLDLYKWSKHPMHHQWFGIF